VIAVILSETPGNNGARCDTLEKGPVTCSTPAPATRVTTPLNHPARLARLGLLVGPAASLASVAHHFASTPRKIG
jgi:hypothetical protein